VLIYFLRFAFGIRDLQQSFNDLHKNPKAFLIYHQNVPAQPMLKRYYDKEKIRFGPW